MKIKRLDLFGKTAALLTFWLVFACAAALAETRSTNISVDSQNLEQFGTVKKNEAEEYSLYKDENVVVGFNEDAEPNVGMRF